MQYLKLKSYEYQDRPDEQVICFGQDPSGLFIHQIIEDRQLSNQIPLTHAVEMTNDATVEFAKEMELGMSFGDREMVWISDTQIIFCSQRMSFKNGNEGIQANAYFFDPQDNVFRMIQFGTLPMSGDLWEQQGEALAKYTTTFLRRLISNMCTPDNIMKLPLPKFIPVK